jgi:hypothetical protein
MPKQSRHSNLGFASSYEQVKTPSLISIGISYLGGRIQYEVTTPRASVIYMRLLTCFGSLYRVPGMALF